MQKEGYPGLAHAGVPAEYGYAFQTGIRGSLMRCMSRFYPGVIPRDLVRERDIHYSTLTSDGHYAFPQTGRLVFGDDKYSHDIWVVAMQIFGDCEPQCVLYFHDKARFVVLQHDLEEKYKATIPKDESSGFDSYEYCLKEKEWRTRKWVREPSNRLVVGHEQDIETLVENIVAVRKLRKKLEAIGEAHSFNIIFAGPPGTGKTTTVKQLCMKTKSELYNVDASVLDTLTGDEICELLNPSGDDDDDSASCRILALEDFDKFLIRGKVEMSTLLNGLNGIGDNSGVIRIFTVNDINVVKQTEALWNRIDTVVYFQYPTYDDFKKKLLDLLVKLDVPLDPADEEKMERFLSGVAQMDGLTLRPFSRHVTTAIAHAIIHEKLPSLFDSLLESMDNVQRFCQESQPDPVDSHAT